MASEGYKNSFGDELSQATLTSFATGVRLNDDDGMGSFPGDPRAVPHIPHVRRASLLSNVHNVHCQPIVPTPEE